MKVLIFAEIVSLCFALSFETAFTCPRQSKVLINFRYMHIFIVLAKFNSWAMLALNNSATTYIFLSTGISIDTD